MENFRKVKDMMIETTVGIVGIVVTIISIIVTTIPSNHTGYINIRKATAHTKVKLLF